jgi:DNA polymerase V
MALFALIDGNNFYVSCDRVFRPSLKSWPVVIFTNKDGCVNRPQQRSQGVRHCHGRALVWIHKAFVG